MKRYTVILITTFLLALFTGNVHAPLMSVRSEYMFDRAVTQASFAVVYMYYSKLCTDEYADPQEAKRITRCYNTMTRHNRMVLKALQSRYRYNEGGLQCIVVDASKRGVSDLASTYMCNEDSAFLFFRHGHLVEGVPLLTGKVARITVENSIEDLWQKELDEIIQKKEAARKQLADERRMAHAWWWSSGGYPFPGCGYGYGCGYPGWGCGYYPYYGGYGGCGRRGYVNVGFGFGC